MGGLYEIKGPNLYFDKKNRSLNWKIDCRTFDLFQQNLNLRQKSPFFPPRPRFASETAVSMSPVSLATRWAVLRVVCWYLAAPPTRQMATCGATGPTFASRTRAMTCFFFKFESEYYKSNN